MEDQRFRVFHRKGLTKWYRSKSSLEVWTPFEGDAKLYTAREAGDLVHGYRRRGEQFVELSFYETSELEEVQS